MAWLHLLWKSTRVNWALVLGGRFFERRGDPAPWAVRGNQRPTDGTETQARAKVPTAQGVAQIASYGATGGRIRP